MRRIINITGRNLFLLALLLLSPGCEEVIDLDLETSPPRLVVNGLIRVNELEAFVPVAIRLTETNNFFEEIPVTQAESVIIIWERFDNGEPIETLTSSLAEETPGSGIYIPDPNATFDQRIPVELLNDETRFTLQISHKGRQYVAQTVYQPVVPIDFVVQGNRTLFEGDETEVIVAFTDLPQENDFYLFDFSFGEYLVTEDTFYQGQLFQFSYFYEDEIEPGTQVPISIMGADESFYNYMDLLITQSGDLQGPFQSPVATVRGNVVDVTDIDNLELFDNTNRPEVYPLGYFAVVQEDIEILTIN